MRRGLALLAGAMLVACLDFRATSPDTLLYLTFEELPFPAVVLGDTLRDSSGAAAPLRARAVGGDGSELSSSVLRFYAIDDTLRALAVDSLGAQVVAVGTAPTAVKVVAGAGSIQSPPLTLHLVKRPDTLELASSADTVEFSFADSTRNFSAPLSLKVLHHDSLDVYSGVQGWVVRYYLERTSDTVVARLVDEQNRRMRGGDGSVHIDSSLTDGSVARKLRIAPGPPLSPGLDSVAVLVEAKYRGEHIAGSPARIMVYTRPRITP